MEIQNLKKKPFYLNRYEWNLVYRNLKNSKLVLLITFCCQYIYLKNFNGILNAK